MAFTIASSVGASMAAATGQSTQAHICYAVNQGAWWVPYLSSTQSLSAVYSTNLGASWTAPSGSPFSLAYTHGSEGRNFGFCYGNISSTDILHMVASYYNGGTQKTTHARFTLGTTWTNTNVEASDASDGPTFTGYPGGGTTLINSSATIFDYFINKIGDADLWLSTNADSGSSWTAGGTNTTNLYTGASFYSGSTSVFSIGSGNALILADNGVAQYACTNINWTTNVIGRANSQLVFGSNFTQTSAANSGACRLSGGTIPVVALSNNNNTFVAAVYSSGSFSSMTAPGNLTLASNSGISLVPDGSGNMWAAAIDSSKNIQTNQWNGSSWSGWSVLEATRTNTPAYITGCYSASLQYIMWAWTEYTGSNYNIVGSTLSTGAGPTFLPWIFGDQIQDFYG